MSPDPEDPAFQPTGKYDEQYDEAAIKRARELLSAMPENVGPYRILERIGGGGMGDVYRAEQRSPIRRQVALKFIKLGMDSKAVITRFEAERQALALMDHPHIAKVFDAGTDDTGRPYFVMEYVKGKPITDYSDQNHLTIPERLKLFEQVCQAVQHAHHKGVIHRDLKPGNVLVSTQDDEPFAKVIDFGVAKAISQNLTDGTLFTQHDQFIGTPQYMSPEQAGGSVDIDTRTDVYSLGVLLYELLTGSTPFSTQELKAAAFDQIKKLIIEVDPPKPSTRLGPQTPTLSSLATFRRTEPKRLGTLVQGELDWIVMKSIDKDRRRRYETPTSLANDILAHLKGEPVQAAPPSTVYRIQKFVRKNWGLVIGVAAVMTALLIGVFGTTWGLVRARIAERDAIESKNEKEVALGLVTDERDAKEKQRQLAEAATKAESKQREAAERHLVSGILRPIGFNDAFGTAELKSFDDWSALGDSRLQLLALQIAFEDPATALRVARRAERVIQSCVGLSPERWAAALDFVTMKQLDSGTDPRIRVAACWLALELGSAEIPALGESLLYLSQPSHKSLDTFREFVALIVTRNDPKQQEVVNRIGGDGLIAVLEESKESQALNAAATGLIDLVPRLDSMQVSQESNALIGVLKKSTDKSVVTNAARGLVTLAPRLEPMQVAKSWDALIPALENFDNDMDSSFLSDEAKGLVSLASHLEPSQVTRNWDKLILVLEVLEKSKGWKPTFVAGKGLFALAPRLESTRVAKGWDTLIAMTVNPRNSYVQTAAREGLVALASRLEQAQVIEGWNTLFTVLEKSALPEVLTSAGEGLAALAIRLEPIHVSRGFDALMTILDNTDDRNRHSAVVDGLIALVPRLEAMQAARAWDALMAVLQEGSHDMATNTSEKASKGLVALVPRLEPSKVIKGWKTVIAFLEQSKDQKLRFEARNVLQALSPRLELNDVMSEGDSLIEILQKTTDKFSRLDAIDGVLALYPRLNSLQARRVWDVWFAAPEKSTDSLMSADGAGILIGSVPQLDPAQFTRLQDGLFAVLQKSDGFYSKWSAIKWLAALAPQMESTQFAWYVDGLIRVLEHQEDAWSVSAAHDGLVELVPRLEPLQVTRSWYALIGVLGFHTIWTEPPVKDEGLVAVAMRMEVIVRERVVEQAVVMFCDITASDDRQSYQMRPIDGGFDIVKIISHPRTLAKLLSHPGCVGQLRQVMLLRFEELVLHGGQPVFSHAEAENEGQVARVSTHQRKFHNLHDAAVWIQQNWPDFDLETNHPVNWRTEQR